MEALHPLPRKFSRFICTLSLLLCVTTCWAQPPCGGAYNGAGILPITTEGYGCGATLNPAQYKQMHLRPGEHVKLRFVCPSVGINPVLPSNLTVSSSYSGGITTVTILVDTNAVAGTTLTVNFTSPASYNFTIKVAKSVWPGDANADGHRNMHDLMPIALGIRRNISGPVPASALLYPPQLSQMNTFLEVINWDSTFKVGAKTINFKHADCNQDGFIDEEDIEYLLAVLTPAAPPNYLLDAVQGLQIKAAFDNDIGMELVVNDDATMGLRVPFYISVDEPTNTFVKPIFGVSFTRPVAETDTYTVASTRFVFPIPNLWNVITMPGDAMLWEQRFWNKIGIIHKEENCATFIDKPLDVGVYRKAGPMSVLPLAPNGRVGNCQVTLLEILSPANPTPPSFWLQQHLLNGIAYTMNNNNTLSPVALECSTDNMFIDMSSFCSGGFRRELLIRDGAGDNGQIPTDNFKGWNSPDVWVRANPDGGLVHQDPSPNLPAHIYVRVFNPTCFAVDSAIVTIYAAVGRTDQRSSDFTPIATINLPTIGAWDNSIQQVPYTFPLVANPNPNYTPAYTIFAVVELPSQPAPLLGSMPLADLVRLYSTIGMRTGHVLKTTNTLTPIRFALPSPLGANDTLHLTQVDGSTSHPASTYGSIQLVFYDCTPTSALGLDPITVPTGATAAYELQSNSMVAWLKLGSISSTNPYIGITYVPGPTPPAGPLAYRFLLQLHTGIIYPGQSFTLSVP